MKRQQLKEKIDNLPNEKLEAIEKLFAELSTDESEGKAEENSPNKNLSTQEVTPPQSHTFKTFVSKSVLNDFRQTDKSKKEEFINNFIEKNKEIVEDKNEVYSLLLNSAIVFKDADVVDYILSSTKNQIFIHKDSLGSSPIDSILLGIGTREEDVSVLKLFAKYCKDKLGLSAPQSTGYPSEEVKFLLEETSFDSDTLLNDYGIDLEFIITTLGNVPEYCN